MDFILQSLIFETSLQNLTSLFLIEKNAFKFLLDWVLFDDKNKLNATWNNCTIKYLWNLGLLL